MVITGPQAPNTYTLIGIIRGSNSGCRRCIARAARRDPVRLARHQRCSGGNRDGESSAPAAFVYVAEVTRERRNRSAGTHTRSPPDPFRAPAHDAPRNEHTSRPEADRIDVAPRAERCVCLPLRNDAVQSQARSRRCSFHSARNRHQALKASSQRRHALAFVQDVCSPQWRTMAATLDQLDQPQTAQAPEDA